MLIRRLLSRVINHPTYSTLSTTAILNQVKDLHSKTRILETPAASSLSTPKLQTKNLTALTNHFFCSSTQQSNSFSTLLSQPTTAFQTSPYVSGPVLTPNFVQRNKAVIEDSKKELKKLLDPAHPQIKDLSVFIDCLFDFEKSKKLIQKIDSQTKKILAIIKPGLFVEYEKLAHENQKAVLNEFFKNQFLPTLRTTFQELAKHYGFDPKLVETNDGLLLDDDYMDFVLQRKLILDLGEDGHGPFPHMIAAFMMKELELEAKLFDAGSLYQSLAHRSQLYCPHRMNFEYSFRLLLDLPNGFPLRSTVFCNPSSLSNHLLFNSSTLKQFAVVCKKHSSFLAQLSCAEWKERENKNHLSMGKVLMH